MSSTSTPLNLSGRSGKGILYLRRALDNGKSVVVILEGKYLTNIKERKIWCRYECNSVDNVHSERLGTRNVELQRKDRKNYGNTRVN